MSACGLVVDGSGIGLFDSGVRTPVDAYGYTFTGAGGYPVTDARTGRTTAVKVPVAVSPAGDVEDVQVKDPGASTWSPWLSGQLGVSAAFTPDHGSGMYSFHARLRDGGSGNATAYSATVSVSVS